MNNLLRKSISVLGYPVSLIKKAVQDKMDFLRTYKLKLIIARVLRLIRMLRGNTASVQFPDSFYPSLNASGNKNTGFIDHSYHYKTVSSSFFMQMMRQFGPVTVLWDSQWNGGKFPSVEKINEAGFDTLILWQIMIYHDPEKLKNLDCKNIIIIPMYDDIHADPDALFLRYRDFRFVSFCRDLQQRFDRLGLQSRYVQYFMDPAALPYREDPFTELHGFFWQRTNDITWDHIRKLVDGSGFTSFHLHLALDPIWYREVLPSEEEMERYHITISRWFEKKEDYMEVLSRANVFFTPRLYEGIGMPVIEAMTMGKLVVAPDHPTVNEYITHGVNGLLYDTGNPEPLDFSDARAIAVKARTCCIEGAEKWEASKTGLMEFIS